MFYLGGAITYFRRYALLSILGLSADVEADPEDFKEPPASDPVAAKPVKATTAPIPKDLPLETKKGPNGESSERDKVIEAVMALPTDKAQAVIDAFKKQYRITTQTIAKSITSNLMQRSSIEPSKLSPSENIRCAVEHLRAVADNDYSQLFFRSQYTLEGAKPRGAHS